MNIIVVSGLFVVHNYLCRKYSEVVTIGADSLQAKISKKEVFVSMSNLLVRASHGLSLAERRILMLAISRLDPKKKYTDNPLVRVHASDIVNLAGVTPQTAYEDGRNGQKRLYERSITLLHDIKTGELKPGSTRWITTAHYQKNEGWLEVAINNELLPYITELRKEFTSYDHSRTGGFRSIYSHRVFDLLMQFKFSGLLRIDIEEFTNAVEAPPSVRANFANMKRRIIEPAIKEIEEKDGLEIKWKAVKAGRKVKSLEFTFPTEQQKKIPLNQPKKSAPKRKLTEGQQAKQEQAAELKHLKMMAERAGVPLETLLPKENAKKEKAA